VKKLLDRTEVFTAMTMKNAVFLGVANVVPSSLILSTLKMEATRSFVSLFLTRPARRHIPKGPFSISVNLDYSVGWIVALSES
jgi:hypothetical protein